MLIRLAQYLVDTAPPTPHPQTTNKRRTRWSFVAWRLSHTKSNPNKFAFANVTQIKILLTNCSPIAPKMELHSSSWQYPNVVCMLCVASISFGNKSLFTFLKNVWMYFMFSLFLFLRCCCVWTWEVNQLSPIPRTPKTVSVAHIYF